MPVKTLLRSETAFDVQRRLCKEPLSMMSTSKGRVGRGVRMLQHMYQRAKEPICWCE